MKYPDEEETTASHGSAYMALPREMKQFMTNKIAPLFDGRTSWFLYEQQLDEFIDMTTLPADKVGPAIRIRLVGEAAM